MEPNRREEARSSAGSALRAGAAWVGSLAVVLGCSAEAVQPASFVAPVYAEPCRFSDCGSHGACAADDDGTPTCLCEVGYQGASCGACEDDFHRDSLDRCLPDRRCADQPSNPCGRNGACTDDDGVIVCACAVGYEGPRCNLCSDRYERDERDRCLPLTLVRGEPPRPADGIACPRGWAGPGCAACAVGYHLAGETCVSDESCEPETCPPNATCNVVEGKAVCACAAGYAGAGCTQCAAGYHPAESVCVPDEVCGGSTCDGHATCVVANGETRCDCDLGWGGERCERCVDLATESTAFEFVTGWPPTPNTCGSHQPELSISRLTLRSRRGLGPVYLCARSTFNGLTTQHVEVEAGPLLATGESHAAELAFWQPVVLLSFDYATRLDALALDVHADGRAVATIELPPRANGSLTLDLDPPATLVSLQSRTGVLQYVGLDNIIYHYERCR